MKGGFQIHSESPCDYRDNVVITVIMAQPPLQVNAAIFTQQQFCSATGLTMVMTNNLMARDLLSSDKIAGRYIKGATRLWSFETMPVGRIISDLTTDHKIPLGEAAEIGKQAVSLAKKGGYFDHWARALDRGRPFVSAFLVVARFNDCYDAQIINRDKERRPDFSSAPNMRRFFKRPFLILPLSDIFEDVWRKARAILAAEHKPGES
jgi:hypothetical protein